jgi:hypothetical protein
VIVVDGNFDVLFRDKTSISGPEYFGYKIDTIAKLIQELPNAHLCPFYQIRLYEGGPQAKRRLPRTTAAGEEFLKKFPKLLKHAVCEL